MSGTNTVDATPARRVLSPLLGPGLPYLLHLRPAEWPIMAAHVTVAWLLASGLQLPDAFAITGIAAWVIALNGGTLALNSAFDRDDGDIAYLRSPPPVPRWLAHFALLLMIGGLVVTWEVGRTWRIIYAMCVLLSIMYSVPPLRLKRIGGIDWLINLVGFGLLTPLAGWELSGRPLDRIALLVFIGFALLFGALYPLTQLYQMDADRARGDRNFAALLGRRGSLRAALLLATAAFTVIGAAAWLSHWVVLPGLRWAALGAAFLAWLAVLLPWKQAAGGWTSAEQQRGMYHALAAWALTDLAVLVAWVF